jgi:hypothetical protein
MSSWVLVLLIVYMSLGLSRMSQAKAMRLAVVITALVVGGELMRLGAI